MEDNTKYYDEKHAHIYYASQKTDIIKRTENDDSYG